MSKTAIIIVLFVVVPILLATLYAMIVDIILWIKRRIIDRKKPVDEYAAMMEWVIPITIIVMSAGFYFLKHLHDE